MDGLTVRQLSAWYATVAEGLANTVNAANSPNTRWVLQDISFDLPLGQTMAVIGHNGSGRSTLAKALMGLIPCDGRITWQGQAIEHLPTHQRARLGLSWVPEQRGVFTKLSVLDNLRLGQSQRSDKPDAGSLLSLEGLLHLFAQLQKRLHVPAGHLSGGEQQMLCIARALIGRPSLLIVDEATEGLAPELQQQLLDAFVQLKRQRMGMILIDQNQHLIQTLADHALHLQQGRAWFVPHSTPLPDSF